MFVQLPTRFTYETIIELIGLFLKVFLKNKIIKIF
jgi:hypothetical protein